MGLKRATFQLMAYFLNRCGNFPQGSPYFPAFKPPAAYPIIVGQTSANLHWLACGYMAGC
jgi:hypothetical protein